MDYESHYTKLVDKAKNKILKEGEYYEKHHIIPRCMGGNDSIENLVTLTAREHYVAHWLLAKMHKENWKLKFAFFQMSKMNKKNSRVITSHQFNRAKKYLSEGAKQRAIEYNPGRTPQARIKAKTRMLTDNPNKGGATNHTSRPIEVLYESGNIEKFEYAKALTDLKGICYSTVKYMIKKSTPSKKHKIVSVRYID